MKTLGYTSARACLASVVGAALIGLTACGAPPAPPVYVPPPPPPAVRAPATMLNTAGTTVIAADSSFELRPHAQIATPFAAGTCPANPTTETFNEAIAGGARPVFVTSPYHNRALYGLLSFCPMPPGTTGPAARLHLVQVPQEYVNATAGGLISVVYEPITSLHQPAQHPGMLQLMGTPAPQSTGSVPAWILYLSQQPFPGVAVTPMPAAAAQFVPPAAPPAPVAAPMPTPVAVPAPAPVAAPVTAPVAAPGEFTGGY